MSSSSGFNASEKDELSSAVIGAAIEAHRHLGPGLLESVYEECLCYELGRINLPFRRQVELPVEYKGAKLNCDFRIDLVVNEALVVEIKAVEALLPVHSAQLLTYLKLAKLRVGLLLNFNVPVLKDGIRRMVCDVPETQGPGNAK